MKRLQEAIAAYPQLSKLFAEVVSEEVASMYAQTEGVTDPATLSRLLGQAEGVKRFGRAVLARTDRSSDKEQTRR